MNLSFPALKLDSRIVDMILRDGTFAGEDDIKGSSAKPKSAARGDHMSG